MAEEAPKPRLLDRRQVAARLTVSQSTVGNLVVRGELPPPIKIGSSSRWLETDVEDYLRTKDYLRKMTPDSGKGDHPPPSAGKEQHPRPKREQPS